MKIDQTLFNFASTLPIKLKADGYEEVHVYGNHYEPFKHTRELDCTLCGPVDDNDEWDLLNYSFEDFSIEVASDYFYICNIDDYYVENGILYIVADLYGKD